MPSKGAIQHTSIDAVQFKDVDTKKSATSRKSVESKLGKSGRRSQSLDRLEENSGDSRDERRNRRQFMHLVGTLTFSKFDFNLLFRFLFD